MLFCMFPDELNTTVMRNRPTHGDLDSPEEQLGTAAEDGNKNGTIKLLLHFLVSTFENHNQVATSCSATADRAKEVSHNFLTMQSDLQLLGQIFQQNNRECSVSATTEQCFIRISNVTLASSNFHQPWLWVALLGNTFIPLSPVYGRH